MSNDIQQQVLSDLTPEELQQVEEFKNEGLPGISAAKAEKVKYALQLYLDNQTFNYISQKTGLKKKIVLYLAHKHNWYQTKIDSYKDMANTLSLRMNIAKAQGLDHLTEMSFASRKYFQDKIDLFKESGDPKVLETLDPNLVKMYYKTLELLFKFTAEQKDGDTKNPLVGINIPEGATIKQNSDNTIVVTPNSQDQAISNALSAIAAMNRLREELEEQKNKKER